MTAVVATLGVAAGTLIAYDRYANTAPALPPEPVAPLPSPNAHHEYIAAGKMVRTPRAEARDALFDLVRGRAKPETIPEIRPVLPSMRPAVARARRAMRLRHGWRVSYSYRSREPERIPLGSLVNAFAASGHVAMVDGRLDDAATDALDALHICRDFAASGAFSRALHFQLAAEPAISLLDGVAPRLERKSARATLTRYRRIARSWRSHAAVLKEEGRYHRYSLTEMINHGLLWESIAHSETLALWLSAWSTGGDPAAVRVPRQTLIESLRWRLMNKRGIVAEVDDFYRRLVVEASRPAPARRPVEMPSSDVAELFCHPPRWILRHGDTFHARLRVLEATLAARVFELERARPPRSLDELAPRYLDRVPVDPFTGGPLRFTLRTGAPVIYSTGSDGTDDGGSPPAFQRDEYGPGRDIVAGHLVPPRGP